MLPLFLKVQKGNGLKTDVSVIRQCKCRGIIFICHEIIIPLLDPQRRRPDHVTIILPYLPPGPPRFHDPAGTVKKRLFFRHFVISHRCHPCFFFHPLKTKTRIPTGTGLLYLFYYATFSFARAASAANPSLSFTARSASIFLLMSTLAIFRPCMNLL